MTQIMKYVGITLMLLISCIQVQSYHLSPRHVTTISKSELFMSTGLDKNENSRSFSIFSKAFVLASSLTFSNIINPLVLNKFVANAADITEQKYGLKKDRLLSCKSQSNCISSSSINSLEKYGRPWSFSKSPNDEYNELKSLIQKDAYLTLVESELPGVENNKLYLHATAKSAVPPTSLDDIEFLINPLDKIITYRSSSRDVLMAGFSMVPDGNSNRNRLEAVRRQLGLSEMQQSNEVDQYVKDVTNMNLISQMKMMSEPNDINFIDNSVPTNSAVAVSAPTASTGDGNIVVAE